MKPSLDLAKQLAGAVLDQVERDRCLNDARLAEAILARMAVLEVVPDRTDTNATTKALADAGLKLWQEMCDKAVVSAMHIDIQTAWLDLHMKLAAAGRLR